MNFPPIKIEELKVIVVCKMFKNDCKTSVSGAHYNGLQFSKIYLYATYWCLHRNVIVIDLRINSLCQGNIHTLCVNNIKYLVHRA